MPARFPFRLPLEYAVRPALGGLVPSRVLALVISSVGALVAVWWTTYTAGPTAAALMIALIATNTTLVTGLTSASYVPWVSTLWTAGLVSLLAGVFPLAVGCGVALALLRPTSWWQAGYLLVAAGYWWVVMPRRRLIRTRRSLPTARPVAVPGGE